jgi:putative addiction module CopG family antidote
MRSIVNISLPPKMVKMIKQEVKEGGYASVSEFIRYLLRTWHAQQLLKEIEQSEEDIKAGRVREIKSLKDLMDSNENIDN